MIDKIPEWAMAEAEIIYGKVIPDLLRADPCVPYEHIARALAATAARVEKETWDDAINLAEIYDEFDAKAGFFGTGGDRASTLRALPLKHQDTSNE